MTKKLRFVLIAVLALIACACLFAGCTIKLTLDDVLGDLNERGAVVDVTYFANEGSFNGNSSSKVRNIRCKDKGRAIDIGNTSYVSGSLTIAAKNRFWEFDGWYWAETDEDGNAICVDGSIYEFSYDSSLFGKDEGATADDPFNENKYIKRSDRPFDFKNTVLEKGTHYYLVAKWKKAPAVQVLLAGVPSIKQTAPKDETDKDSNTEQTKKDPIVYNKGDELTLFKYNDKKISMRTAAPISDVEDASFIEYYADAECTQLVSWPILLTPEAEEDVDHPLAIYARYIEGLWTVVKTADDVEQMFDTNNIETSVNFGSNRFFIFGEIDCKDKTVSARTGYTGFACTIVGDEGSKIKNLKVTATFFKSQTNYASFFGEIAGSAVIKNIVFENLTQEYMFNETANANDGVYFAFSKINEGAQIENVKISGTMTVTLGGNNFVANLEGGAKNNWKFGGFENDSDYTGGITVTSSDDDLIIN